MPSTRPSGMADCRAAANRTRSRGSASASARPSEYAQVFLIEDDGSWEPPPGYTAFYGPVLRPNGRVWDGMSETKRFRRVVLARLPQDRTYRERQNALALNVRLQLLTAQAAPGAMTRFQQGLRRVLAVASTQSLPGTTGKI